MHEPGCPRGLSALLFGMQTEGPGLEGAPAGQGVRPGCVWICFLGRGKGTEGSRVSEHKRYPLKEPLGEQGGGAELWSAQSRNGSGKKWRRKSREMVTFPPAQPSQHTWSTKTSPPAPPGTADGRSFHFGWKKLILQRCVHAIQSFRGWPSSFHAPVSSSLISQTWGLPGS